MTLIRALPYESAFQSRLRAAEAEDVARRPKHATSRQLLNQQARYATAEEV